MATVDLAQIRVAPTLHWVEAFGLWLKQNPTAKKKERNFKTISAYLIDVRIFSAYFEEVNQVTFTLDQLNSTDLEAYFKALAEGSPATYNRKHASLCMLVKFAQDEGLLEYDPMAWIPRMDAVRKAPRDLDANEQASLCAVLASLPDTTLDLRDRLLVTLMIKAGLRIHEAAGLKVTDLHLDEGYIHVLGKGQKHRYPQIGSALVDLIRIWLDRKPASVMNELFPGERGAPLTTGQARRRFYDIRDAAGLDPSVTPHALRHTYINNLLTAYMDGDPTHLGTAIKAVCQQTGDDPRVILEYYTNPRQSDIRAAVEML